MPEILQYGFMQRALLAGAMIGTIAPVIGVFLVLRRLSLIADTLAHVALAGVAVGLLLGAYPVAGALVAALLGAVGIERLRAVGRLSGETALAIFLSGGLAVAVVVIGLAGGFNVGVFTYLFGAITPVPPRALRGARVQGLPVGGLNLLLTVLVAVTVVVAMRIVGILLTSALIVIPAVTALRLARNFRSALWMAVACSLVSVLAGITASFYLDIPASGALVLGGILLFAGASLLGPRR